MKRDAITNQNQTKLFLHIPKTAGTTLHHILLRHYSPGEIYTDVFSEDLAVDTFRNLPQERKDQIKILWGHFSFGLHQYLPQPTTYFTFLREPVERVLSHYYFVRSRPEFVLNERIEKEKLNVNEVIQQGLIVDIKNVQTRMLAGLPYLFPADAYTEEHLEIAKENLRQHFSVIGLVERFDESLLLLQQAFGWHNIYYMQYNKTLRHEEVSQETLKYIRDENALDMELYRHATTLFQAQVQDKGEKFANQVKRFQLWNRLVFGSWFKIRFRARQLPYFHR